MVGWEPLSPTIRWLVLGSMALGLAPALFGWCMARFSRWDNWRRDYSPFPWRDLLTLPDWKWWQKPALWLWYLLALAGVALAIVNPR